MAWTLRRIWMPLLAISLAAGCSTPPPAPVENRTAPPPVAKVPPRPQAKRPPSRPAPAKSAGVRSAPITSSGVQSRPLSSVPAPAASGEKLRSEPRGDKLAYSNEALAAMKNSPPAIATAPTTGADAAQSGAPVGTSNAGPSATETDKTAAVNPGALFAWPASGPMIKAFAEPTYMGISIGGRIGDPINAAADGKVIFSGVGPRGYGNLVILRHDAETLSVYAHNSRLLVKDGEQVRRGQKIAELGDSGADRPKLHFEVRKAGKPINPQSMLPSR